MEADLDIIGEIDWDSLFLEHNFPDFADILENSNTSEPESVTEAPQPSSIPSLPDDNAAVSSWIGEIEKVLMEDDQLNDKIQTPPISDDFFADLLVDSPSGSCGEVIDDVAAADPATPAASAGSDADADADAAAIQEQNKAQDDNDDDDEDDPAAKKRRRQLRNRDAAVRSRERKKLYVRDLEIKSKYLEGECRRLGRMLQCFVAENQALRLALNKGCAFDASTKQESAVLLLESLLLGSLLWFLGIMCLFTLPVLPNSLLEAVPLVNEEKRSLERVAPRGAGSNLVGFSFVKTRRCKASRTKMKDFDVSGILLGNFSSVLA
ncbi:hypothetical protein CCACVL1_02209 [Corchorus capsularis]|uniref:BZIP domain-containing protein n=1 Tax=Corchorus capsularis TaxID=210143 RepID=A0A1R3KAE6_COCAP|nr:hypothetical protein CCACVL1_02209 [Corchorus capsularis]